MNMYMFIVEQMLMYMYRGCSCTWDMHVQMFSGFHIVYDIIQHAWMMYMYIQCTCTCTLHVSV